MRLVITDSGLSVFGPHNVRISAEHYSHSSCQQYVIVDVLSIRSIEHIRDILFALFVNPSVTRNLLAISIMYLTKLELQYTVFLFN